MKRRDLMSDYLDGHLTGEELQDKLRGQDEKSRRLLAKVGLDHDCRRLLTNLPVPDGAAERLAQVVVSRDLSPEIVLQKGSGELLEKMFQPMPFDVVGAGRPESKSKHEKTNEEKKRKKGKRKPPKK